MVRDRGAAGIISTTGQHRKAWPFYWCSRAKQGGCDAGKVNATRLERAVVERLKADVLTPDSLRRHVDELLVNLTAHREELADRLDALEALRSAAHLV